MLKIRKILKTFIPPIIPLVINYLRGQNNQTMWSGDYGSWDEAQSECTGYNSEVILEKCKNGLLKVKNGEAVYERDSVLFESIDYNWPLLAILCKAALDNENVLSVLDFGGSLGSSYFQNRNFLGGIKQLEWGIVEQAHFINCGKEYFEDSTLKFFYSIEDCYNAIKPNVLLFSSVLQYLEKPFDLVKTIVNLNVPYIIIDRTAFVDAPEDLLTIQKVPETIYKASYPSWFFNKEKFINQFLPEYELIAEMDVTLDPAEFINGRFTYRKGLIFKLHNSESKFLHSF